MPASPGGPGVVASGEIRVGAGGRLLLDGVPEASPAGLVTLLVATELAGRLYCSGGSRGEAEAAPDVTEGLGLGREAAMVLGGGS
ncbi:MAG: hypothetical protein VKQ33_07210 [Candidatus Sericytochromatia bacterium]|nr:hypothetical protein [Candidatus Sericytochromatia bacterium]